MRYVCLGCAFLLAGCYLSHEREPVVAGPDGGFVCDVERHPCTAPDDPIFSRDILDSSHPAVHWWRNGRCVPVSIDPGTGLAWQAQVQRALASWAERGCSPFCGTILVNPYLVDGCDGDRRLHFALRGFMGDEVSVTVFMSEGTLHDAEIVLGDTLTYSELLNRIGNALGLGNPEIGVTVDLVDGDRVLPEAHDAACVLYGPDPLCE